MYGTLGSAIACALCVFATTARAAPQPTLGAQLGDPLAEPPPAVASPTGDLSDAELARLAEAEAKAEVITISGATRGVAEDFLVLPDGVDVGGRLRLITADDGLGAGAIKLTDLALIDLHAEWGVAHGFELDGVISVLAKQPSGADAHVVQGGSLAVRRDLFTRTALAVSGSAGPLAGVKGYQLGAELFLAHKHRVNEFIAFALAGGASSTFLRPTLADDKPYLLEGAAHAAVQCGFNRMWGGWMGAGYALPALHGGRDPVSGMALDPRPRLDLNIGTAIQLGDQWDLSVDLTIIDRGDRSAPATRLPIIDGGFDQIQLGVGISRRVELSRSSRRPNGVGDPMIIL
jgi:hypothetical protein